MNDGHADVAAELWALADTVLTRLEPILRQAADAQGDRDRQGCSWCPVCALAALLRGEQHDLLTLVATEGAGVVALIRQLLAEHGGMSTPAGAPSPGPDTAGAASAATDATSEMPDSTPSERDSSPLDANVARDTHGPVGRPAAFVPITVTIRDSQSGDSNDA